MLVTGASVAVAMAGGLPVEHDLLDALVTAERCRGEPVTCRPRPRPRGTTVSVRLVRLQPRDLFLHLPDAPVLDIDVEVHDAALVVTVEPAKPGGGAGDVHRTAGPGRQRVRVALAAFAGAVVRLAFSVDGDGSADVFALRLHGEQETSAPPPRARPAASAGRPPNVVVYVIDTLRADHLGCHGYPRPTTPRIDGFAQSAVRFTHAVAQSSWTLPAVGSILTGRTPPAHGAVDPDHGLRADVATLAELLGGGGYVTAAFVTNYLGGAAFGLDRGFAVFRFYPERGATRPAVYLPSDVLARRVVRWLDRRVRTPFFLYVHATDPHFPYLPAPRYARPFLGRAVTVPAATRVVDAVRPLHNGRELWGTRPARIASGDLALLRDLYDGDVRAADAGFGRVLDALQARGLLDDTIVVLTSDHGEEFSEHGGVGHGQTLHGEVLHVPLLIRLPGGRDGGRVVDGLVQHVDILPTVLDLAGMPGPPGLDGRPALVPDEAAEAYAALRLGRFAQDAIVGDGWKTIRDLETPWPRRFVLFDTVQDPREQVDVSLTWPVLAAYGRARVRAAAAPRPVGPRIPEERVERLRALGYVADRGS